MTENDDGTAERLRRDWIADALQAHAMCPADTSSIQGVLVPDADGPFGNGGEILYSGRCLQTAPPPPAPVMAPPVRG